MYKSGGILAAVAFFIAAGATLITPLCTPCAAIFLGLGAGYLAGAFDKPSTSSATSRAGAIGGAIAGAGAILGQVIGTVINSYIISPEGLQKMYQTFGLPSDPALTQQYRLVGMVGGAICFSLLDLLLMAGFGALGGMLWWRTAGQNPPPQAPTIVA